MDELVSAVIQRIGAGNDGDRPQLLVSFQNSNIMLGCFLLLFVPNFFFPGQLINHFDYFWFFSMKMMMVIEFYLQVIVILLLLSAILNQQDRR